MTGSISLITFETILLLMIYISVGFYMRKAGIMDDVVTNGITRVFMLTALPAAILNSMINQPFNQELLINIVIVFFSIVVIYFFFAFVGLGIGKLFRIPRERIGVYAFSMSFGNVGLMGFPVVGALWGGLGLFYASAVSLAYWILLPTLGLWLTVKSAADVEGQRVQYQLKPNLAMVASIVGLVWFIFQDFIPVAVINLVRPAVIDGVGGGPIGRFIGGTAAIMTPISMFMIGSLLAKGKPSDLLSEKEALVLSAVKLLIAPVLLFFIVRNFITDPIMLGVLIILSAMPVAALGAVYAEKYKADSAFASRMVFLSTTVSLITIPLVALLLG